MATLGSTIASEFHSLSIFAWLATTYLIATATSQPLSGKLTDIYSRRSGLLICNFFFALGNLLCGLAPNPSIIILGRALAGIGGGGLNTISTIVGSDLIPLRKRGVWQGIGNLCWGLGSGLGGIFGGGINDLWNWRVAFLLQIPVTMMSIIMIHIHVEKPSVTTEKSPIYRVDFLGSLSLVGTLILLLVGVNAGGNLVPWTHPLVLVSLPSAFMLFCAFIVVEEKFASEPIIPIRLVLNRTVAAACFTNLFFISIAYALNFYIVIYLRVRGLSNTSAGAALIPYSVMSASGSLGAGLVTNKTGRYKYLNVAILLLIVLATTIIATFTLSTSSFMPVLALGIVGVSVGGMLTVTLLALVSAADRKDQAVVTSLSYAFRSIGSVLGVAMASAVFQNVLYTRLWAKLGKREHAAELIDSVRESLYHIGFLPPSDQQLVRECCMLALRAVFLSLVGLAVLALFSGLWMREHKLFTRLDRQDESSRD